MATLREVMLAHQDLWLAVGGLLIGMAFGTILQSSNFCAMGSISDIVTFGDYRRFRAWVLAAATALLGAQVLAAAAVVPLDQSMYLAPALNWTGNLLGGALFGFGMVFAGGCASKNLARAGGGDLRALMTLLVMGLFAYMTLGGLLGPLRQSLEQATSLNLKPLQLTTQSLGEVVGLGLHIGQRAGNGLATFGCLAAALYFCFSDARFRASRGHVLSGLAVGLCVIAGWALTGLAFDEMAARPQAPVSLTFVRPTADTVEWLQRFTAGMVPGFGVSSVLGTIVGAAVMAWWSGRFKLATFSSVAETQRSLFGAMLMGCGGVLALGCTIGQGITGVSTLALGSFLTFGALVFGAVQGMKQLERTLMAAA